MDEFISLNRTYILQDQEDIRWCFYLTENKRIGYTTNKLGSWSAHKYIDSPPIKGYAATMDNKGIIRLVAYTTTRQLLYYEFINGNWNSQIIERIYSRFQDIPYYSIHSSAQDVHILYFIDHSLSRSGESMVHYHLHEGRWHGGRLWKFMSDQMTRLHGLCIDKDNKLHILFTQKSRQRFYLYYCSYDPTSLSWIEPIAIHSSPQLYNYRIFIDSAKNLHVLWTRAVDQKHQISHLIKSASDAQGSWRESLIHESQHKIRSPIMLEGNSLYCFWKEDKSIYKMHSKDLGITWSAPGLIRDSLDYETILLNLVYFEQNTPKSMQIWGQGYPDIKFAGLDEDFISYNKQISVDTSSQSPLSDYTTDQGKTRDWIDLERVLASIKRENKGLREGINNLFSQIDHLNSIIYSLQDQMQMNERNLFNINAQIKQLDFQIRQLQLRSRQISPRIYNVLGDHDSQKEQGDPANQRSLEDHGNQEDQRDQDDNIDEIQELNGNGKIQNNCENKTSQGDIYENFMNKDKSDYENSDSNEAQGEVMDAKETREEDKEDDIQENGRDTESEVNINEDKGEKDIQRISLGNTVILINPENPEDF